MDNLATCPHLSIHEVAVKVLSLAFHEEAAHVRSFKKEVDVLSRVNHPHIVKLMGASLAPPDVCIVEELMPNGSLHDALHKRRWKPSYVEILTIVHDVAAALAYLHPRIVHCDLKPQNVLLTLEDRAKVADFGLSKCEDLKTTVASTMDAISRIPGSKDFRAAARAPSNDAESAVFPRAVRAPRRARLPQPSFRLPPPPRGAHRARRSPWRVEAPPPGPPPNLRGLRAP